MTSNEEISLEKERKKHSWEKVNDSLAPKFTGNDQWLQNHPNRLFLHYNLQK